MTGTTTPAQVLDGVESFVKGVLPNAKILRAVKKPTVIDPGGNVIIFDGDPGEPVDVLLSPYAETYDHHVPLSLAAYPSATDSGEGALTAMWQALDEAVKADRTLGGVCEYARLRQPAPDDAEVMGAEPVRWAEPALICTYTALV